MTIEERPATSSPELSTEIRDAAKQLMQLLPPQERAAVLLKDVFDFQLDEIAAILQTIGMGTSYGREPIRESSLYYCLFLEKVDPHAERRAFLGEPIVVIWYADLDDPAKRAAREVFRFEEVEGQIARLCFFGFCPETESEILNTLGLPFSRLGYGVWAPEFNSLRKEEEFQQWRASEHPEWVDRN